MGFLDWLLNLIDPPKPVPPRFASLQVPEHLRPRPLPETPGLVPLAELKERGDQCKKIRDAILAGRAEANLVCPTDLDLKSTKVRRLPPNLTVRGTLNLEHCSRLREIGAGLDVQGNLKIGGGPGATAMARRTPLKALPEGLKVKGDLELWNCFLLESWPNAFSIGGSLNIQGCSSLGALPDSLEVKGNLTIGGGRALRALPKFLKVAGTFKLSGTRVRSLPENLHIGEDLIVEGRAPIEQIPSSIHVGRNLTLRGCPIEAIPADLRIRQDLLIANAKKLRSLPAGLKVQKNLSALHCPSLEALPEGLKIGRSLRLQGCTGLKSLPAGLSVPGFLNLRGCRSLAALPAGLSVGSKLGNEVGVVAILQISNCPSLVSISPDLKVSGLIEAADVGLKELPPRLRHLEFLWRGVRVPSDVLFSPESLTVDRIFGSDNAELRRVMLERIGIERALEKAKARVIHEDRDPGGERRLYGLSVARQERRYLFCQCPSTGRKYLLRVPPTMNACHAAAAWIAGFDDPKDFNPALET